MPQIIQGLAAGTQVKSPTISTLSHTDNLHAQVISIPHPLPPIPPHLQHLVCPGRVFRELTATRFRCFSWCWGAGERLPQTHTQQESISLTMALRGLSGHVGGGRSHGLFLFYAHPVTLATENKRRQSTTYHTLMHGEAWGVEEALAWKSEGQHPAWALLATGQLPPSKPPPPWACSRQNEGWGSLDGSRME